MIEHTLDGNEDHFDEYTCSWCRQIFNGWIQAQVHHGYCDDMHARNEVKCWYCARKLRIRAHTAVLCTCGHVTEWRERVDTGAQANYAERETP